MYSQIFTIIAPIILIAMLGYTWSLFKLRYDGQFVSKIVMDVGAPCLILATMQKTQMPADQVVLMAKITVTGLLLLFLINSLLLRFSGLNFRTYQSSLTFANTGNMGVPICLFAFGNEALALGLIVFMVTSMFHFSIGVSLAGNEHPLKVLLKSPVFYAAAMAFTFVFTGYQLPTSVFNTIDMLGGIAIPLMLFSLGVSLQSIRAHALQRSLLLALWRLGLGFCIGLLLCWIFELEGIIKGVVLIQSTMPSAVFNYLMAFTYKRQAEEVAGVVVLSTLISFMTLPLLLWFVLQG